MTVYIPSNTISGYGNISLDVIELRTISNLLQRDQGSQAQEELKNIRNDQAVALGLPTPVPSD